MHKNKISHKHTSSFENIPTLHIKKGVEVCDFKAIERIRNKKYVAQALWCCLLENDPHAFKEILKAHLEMKNKEKVVKETGISRRTLFRMLSKNGNPTLDNISRIIHGLCA
ncbi:MAG: hypothetical protein HYS98_00840 [Deltaproteobacteria bacterium]|nr:hypothetical protein [Deltaproteobacteria bacterium]